MTFKKKAVMIAIGLLLCGLLAFPYVYPRPIIDENKDMNIYFIYRNESELAFDENEIVDLLSKYKSRKVMRSYFPYQKDLIDYEIDYYQDGPKHILLGEFNVWYESADKSVYEIIDGEELHKELQKITADSTVIGGYEARAWLRGFLTDYYTVSEAENLRFIWQEDEKLDTFMRELEKEYRNYFTEGEWNRQVANRSILLPNIEAEKASKIFSVVADNIGISYSSGEKRNLEGRLIKEYHYILTVSIKDEAPNTQDTTAFAKGTVNVINEDDGWLIDYADLGKVTME